jgi:hypothetical protein
MLIKWITFCWKQSRDFFNWRRIYFVWPLKYLIKKPPTPTKWATISLFKVESCNALLHMLLVCICSYLKSVLRYKFLILDTYRPDTCIYVSKDVRILCYFSRPKRVRQQESLGNAALPESTEESNTNTLITNKCTKRVLSSIVTHSYMFRPCWVIFRENIFVIVTLRLHFIVEWECAVDCVLRCFWRRELSAVPACRPGPQRLFLEYWTFKF